MYSNNKKVEDAFVARNLSEIFELDYNEVLEKVNSTSSVSTIAKKVEQDKITKLKEWLNEYKITSGINIDEDVKRTYPYNTLAANVIGFCGTDNQGLDGLESTWDNVLKGTPGKIVTSTNVSGQEIPDENKQEIAAQDGSDIILSIDYKIQVIVEKYLKQAVIENNCEEGGCAIIMDPETGDIKAMATYPDYNLNTPFTPNETLLQSGWDNLSSDEKNSMIMEMWRNKASSAVYDPGSTFKLITSAIALEENLIETDNETDFFCSGTHKVSGQTIQCWKYPQSHQYQSLRKALNNSCNPAFMQLGAKIGVSTFYKYMRAFGLFSSTGSTLYGEQSSVMHKEADVNAIELATLSFGQGFSITPLQLITSVCSIVNDGILMQPRIVKQVINTDTNAVTNIEPVEVRQVISKETSAIMRNLMESVVTDGTGGHADIAGYSIGGKSGTSEYLDGSNKKIASFVGIAPTTDTKLVTLVVLYQPTAGNYQGGQVAGPVVKQILTEVLPYLGIASTSTEDNSSDKTITLTDIRNKTVTEAEKILKDAGFTVKVSDNENKTSTLVYDQVPKPGVKLASGSIVCLYTENKNIRVSVSVPNVKGMTLEQARNALKSKNLNMSAEGSGKVITQSYVANTQVEEGTIVEVTLEKDLQGGY